MTGKGFLKIILIIIQLLLVSTLRAQLIEADTIQSAQEIPKKEAPNAHSPRKATIYSAVLPGLGQVYNKKYWKVPVIYLGFGTIAYFINWNNDNYQLFRRGYFDLIDDDPETQGYLEIEAVRRNNYDLNNPTHFNNLRTALMRQKDYFRRNRDLLFIGMVGFYGLNIIDASVDAHFFDFDISDDLTLKWEPSLMQIDNNFVYCINFRFSF
ncbi:MAG: DUF5683 domain-containing protein [Mariniphaga sp.]|nr:DUF5683 domain-containing protein [Mariniphaga sp.]